MYYCNSKLGLARMAEDYKTPEAFAEHILGYYDLILIMEFFDESLILLKQLLSLEYDDIIYLRAKENHGKNFSEEDLTENSKEIILKRQSIDKILYDCANRTLWRKITHFGLEKMDFELKIFRELKEKADQNDLLLNLQGKKFMNYMKNKQLLTSPER